MGKIVQLIPKNNNKKNSQTNYKKMAGKNSQKFLKITGILLLFFKYGKNSLKI